MGHKILENQKVESFSWQDVSSNIHAQNTVCWHITENCNLNCSFCEIKQNKANFKEELKFLKKNWPNFKKQFNKLPGTWEVFLMGGEPLSLPGILEIVNDLVKQGHKISLATNFSFSTSMYEKFLKIVGAKLCLLFATFKPEYYNPEVFLKKAEHINNLVKAQGGQFGVGAVAEPD
ncbi:MAG: radical SAM protein, partial [Nanoarchaeota archaeon]